MLFWLLLSRYQVLCMSTESVGKIEELESIRGIAALLVVLFHMPTWNVHLRDIRFIQNGYYMVDLFFVLSGFVMNLNYGDRLHSVGDLARFQFLRLGRLYPVHLLFLLLAVATTASGWFAATAFGLHNPNGSGFKGATFASFAEQLLLIHSLGFFNIAHPFNLPSWSISVEFYTYLVFGIMCLISQFVLRLSVFVVVAGAALALLSFGGKNIGNFSEILQCLAGYFLGCLVASFAARHPHALVRGSTLVSLAAMTLFLCAREDSAVRYCDIFSIRPAYFGGGLQPRRLREGDFATSGAQVSWARFLLDLHVAYICPVGLQPVRARSAAPAGGDRGRNQYTPNVNIRRFALAGSGRRRHDSRECSGLQVCRGSFRLKSKEIARRFLTPKRRFVPVAVVQTPE